MANSDPDVQFNLPYKEDGPVNAGSPGAAYTHPERVSEASDSDSTHRHMSLSKQPSCSRSSRDLWKAVDTLQCCIRDLATEVNAVKGAHAEAFAIAQTSTKAMPIGDQSSSLQQPASSLDCPALINVNMFPRGPDAPSFHAVGDSNQRWAAPATHQFTPLHQRAPQLLCMPINERIKMPPFTSNETLASLDCHAKYHCRPHRLGRRAKAKPSAAKHRRAGGRVCLYAALRIAG
ncbi:hypothetical protein DPMN_119119 [Dreissena polymorpha]|uniref:Uncharacterized protein n=1 Tax=Dreissena polymorpha TaxID=45954 RepID=A0A9D4JMI6_DREPO|nr:hypothetical protein DPMN_119119 [Dreissena polymorpha]